MKIIILFENNSHQELPMLSCDSDATSSLAVRNINRSRYKIRDVYIMKKISFQ